MPDIMPEDSVLAANLAVESMIFVDRRLPRLLSVIWNRARVGRMKSFKSRHCEMNEDRSLSSDVRICSSSVLFDLKSNGLSAMVYSSSRGFQSDSRLP